ncbi:MAG: hypothetical protein FWD61_10625 [Phycisphaerales bacterium]|nr:hypothetical protein [Phycisphaerales bacterium]
MRLITDKNRHDYQSRDRKGATGTEFPHSRSLTVAALNSPRDDRLLFATLSAAAASLVVIITLLGSDSPYLSSIPEDRFANAPLHYLKTPAGYLLYSVGPNMIDNAGHTCSEQKKSPTPTTSPSSSAPIRTLHPPRPLHNPQLSNNLHDWSA